MLKMTRYYHSPSPLSNPSRTAYPGRWHYSKDFILNSKNEYNSNHLSRVVLEEDAFIRKKRARQEELEEEVMEKKKWEKFKAEHRRKPKRKPEEDDTLPNGQQKLRRIESLYDESISGSIFKF